MTETLRPIASAEPGPLALSLGGGGARAAYQAGFLHALARRLPDLEFPIITGASAGAINAAHLAHFDGPLSAACADLSKLWASITLDQVFRTDLGSLLPIGLRWLARLGGGGVQPSRTPRGFLDTAPLGVFLRKALDAEEGRLDGVAQNLASGRLRALAVTTNDLGTGQTTTWVQGHDPVAWERPTRRGVPATITLDHVLASCAVPLFFPAVRLGDGWHGDGGIRQIAPLSPALKLGATRIIAISTRHAPSLEDGARPATGIYPPPAQVLGVLLGAVFHDLLDHDAAVLARISALTQRLPEAERNDLCPARVLLLRPSCDLGAMARDHERRLPTVFRFLTRGLGTRETRNYELLSLLLFDPHYTAEMIALGERDAEAKVGEVESFLRGAG